jgi:hypothetical protein
MTTTTKETDMNEFNQIRERFLAHARQHFLASDTNTHSTQCSSQSCDGHSCRDTHDPLNGQNTQ